MPLGRNNVFYQRFDWRQPERWSSFQPLFKRRNERDDRPITAEHEIEQSIIAMGDQFQLNYIHSLLILPSVVLSQAAGKVLLILERC